MISIIAAVADNYAIGKNNKLLWYLSNDLKRFKSLTDGKTVIMGRNTWLSLPVKPLPNRRNIVISDVSGENFPGCITVNSVEKAIDLCIADQENFIIGGGIIYRQFLAYADTMYLTLVHAEFEADTFFPEFDQNEWKLVSREDCYADEKHKYNYSFLIYKKEK